MSKPILRTAAVTIAAAGLTAGTIVGANAQSTTFGDSGGSGPLNIHTSKVAHGKKKVTASTKITNLQKNHNQGIAFHLRTAPKKKRYVAIVSVRKKVTTILAKAKGGSYVPVKCKKIKTDLNFKRDRVKVVVPRTCLGKPKKVSARVETGKVGGKRHDMTAWSKYVKRG